MTAEDLRERIIVALHGTHPADWAGAADECRHCQARADAVVAALAGDPGDLPTRMAEAIGQALNEWSRPDVEATRGVRRWDFLAAAALSVRWEHAARQAAEVERLRAELDAKLRTKALGRSYVEMRGFAQRETARADKAEAEIAELRRTPVAAEGEIQRLQAELAEAKKRVADYEGALNWQTSCLACSKVLDSSIADHDRAEAAEAAIGNARAEAERWRADLKQHGNEAWAVAARHVCACLLAALAVPESAKGTPDA